MAQALALAYTRAMDRCHGEAALIDALVSGRLVGTPAARTARNGSPFVIAKVRAADSKGESALISVIAFNRTAVEALKALQDGDSVCLAGELSIGIYTAKDGTVRPSLDLQAHVVVSEYHVSRKRSAVRKPEPQPQAESGPAQSSRAEAPEAAEADFDDALPF